jgi:hypothetical protein
LKIETPPKSLNFLIFEFFFLEENLPVKRKDLLSKEAKVDEREREREFSHFPSSITTQLQLSVLGTDSRTIYFKTLFFQLFQIIGFSLEYYFQNNSLLRKIGFES